MFDMLLLNDKDDVTNIRHLLLSLFDEEEYQTCDHDCNIPELCRIASGNNKRPFVFSLPRTKLKWLSASDPIL